MFNRFYQISCLFSTVAGVIGLAKADRRVAELSLPVYAQPGDPNIPKLTSAQIQSQFQRQTDMYPSQFKLIAYATQEIREGTNYFGKFQIGNNDYVHLRIFQPRNEAFPGQLVAFMLNMMVDDPIVYFLSSGSRVAATNRPVFVTDSVRLFPQSTRPAMPTTTLRRATTTTTLPPEQYSYIEPTRENNFLIILSSTTRANVIRTFPTIPTRAPIVPTQAPVVIGFGGGQPGFGGNQPGNTFGASQSGFIGSSNNEDQRLSEEQPANDDVRQILAQVKNDYVTKTETNPTFFQLVSFRVQTSREATHFFMKVYVNYNTWDHLRVALPITSPDSRPVLLGIQSKRGLFDSIDYFAADGWVAPAFSFTQEPPIPQPRTVTIPFPPEEPSLLLFTPSTRRPFVQVQPNQPGFAGNRNNKLLDDLTLSARATRDVQRLVDAIKPQFSRKVFDPVQFDALSYRMKLVAGELFFVKVQVSSDESVHLRIFKPVPYNTDRSVLEAWELRRTLEEPINFFGPSNQPQLNPGRVPQPLDTEEDLNRIANPTRPPLFQTTRRTEPPPSQFIPRPESSASSSTSLSSVTAATASTQEIVDAVKPDFMRQSVFQPLMFVAITERVQQASPGLIRFVKVQINTASYVHLKIRTRDNMQPQLMTFDIGKSLADRIDFF